MTTDNYDDAELMAAAPAVISKIIDQAKGGDIACMRLVMDRVLPVPRGRTISLDLRPMNSSADVAGAMADVIRACSYGEITPSEANEVAKLLESYSTMLEVTQLEDRITLLEERAAR